VAAALVQNINAITVRQLEERDRERKKASMLNALGSESQKLFILLSAKDWDDTKPRLNSFMRELVSDKRMARAIEIVHSEMKRWDGTITASGWVQFLSSGYICKSLDDKPSGFTFFMFRPAYVEGAHNPKMVEPAIRETFGDSKLSEETVKFYAKMNYHLPANYEDFLFQLAACYKALELFTRQQGIASEGYRRAYRIMSADRRRYRPLFTVDPSMGIKIGRFLDNLFQNFCSDLAEYASDRNALQKVRRRLEFSMDQKVTRFFEDIRGGIVPSVLLPESLTAASGSFHSRLTEDSSQSGTKKAKKAAAAAATASATVERVVNEEMEEGCRLPKAKRFGDFFTPSKNELRANCTGWPTFPHHLAPHREVPMCIKFQTTGSCTKACKHAHVLPSAMPSTIWGEIKARIKKILGTS
jgi:hypothetical protein